MRDQKFYVVVSLLGQFADPYVALLMTIFLIKVFISIFNNLRVAMGLIKIRMFCAYC